MEKLKKAFPIGSYKHLREAFYGRGAGAGDTESKIKTTVAEPRRVVQSMGGCNARIKKKRGDKCRQGGDPKTKVGPPAKMGAYATLGAE